MFNKASLKCKKIITLTALSASFLLAATGCGKDAANDRLGKGNQVENVINDQMAKEQGTTEGKSEEKTAASTEKASSAPQRRLLKTHLHSQPKQPQSLRRYLPQRLLCLQIFLH
jgi:hypothetical protein